MEPWDHRKEYQQTERRGKRGYARNTEYVWKPKRWVPGKTSKYLMWKWKDTNAKNERDQNPAHRKPNKPNGYNAPRESMRYNQGRRMKYERQKKNLERNIERTSRWDDEEKRINDWFDA